MSQAESIEQDGPASVLLSKKVLDVLSSPGQTFDRAGLLNEIFAALERAKGMSGQAALASMMVEEFEAAKSGTIARQRILETWCRLLNSHSDDVRQTPVEDMSEEELLYSINALLPKLSQIATTPSAARKPRRSKKAPKVFDEPEGEPEN